MHESQRQQPRVLRSGDADPGTKTPAVFGLMAVYVFRKSIEPVGLVLMAYFQHRFERYRINLFSINIKVMRYLKY